MVICLERGADLHMAQLMPLPLAVSCFSKIQTGFNFLVPAHLGIPGKTAVKRVCVFQGRGGQLTPFAPMCGRPCILVLVARVDWPLVRGSAESQLATKPQYTHESTEPSELSYSDYEYDDSAVNTDTTTTVPASK